MTRHVDLTRCRRCILEMYQEKLKALADRGAEPHEVFSVLQSGRLDIMLLEGGWVRCRVVPEHRHVSIWEHFGYFCMAHGSPERCPY